MKKIRKRILTTALAMAIFITAPGVIPYAAAEEAQMDSSIAKTVERTDDDDTEKSEAEERGMMEPDTEKGIADESERENSSTEELTTEDSGTMTPEVGESTAERTGEEADSATELGTETDGTTGPDTENDDTAESDMESSDTEAPETQDKDTAKPGAEDGDIEETDIEDGNLCAHHKEHSLDCGYSPATDDEEGSPCAYECRLCLIEELIAALPEEVTKDNAVAVREQLEQILTLYTELDENEQEQIDLSHCLELQEALEALAGRPGSGKAVPAVNGAYQIYVQVPDSWTDVYCYAYSEPEESDKIENAGWPGESMSKSSGGGYWTYCIPETLVGQQIQLIFSDKEHVVNRFPADMMPGLQCDSEGTWLFTYSGSGENYTWVKHDEQHHFYIDAECAVCGVTPVAKVEKDGKVIAYVGENNFDDAFTSASSGAQVTLMNHVKISSMVFINGNTFTLDLAEYDIDSSDEAAINAVNADLTITGNGCVTANTVPLSVTGGTVNLQGGWFHTSGMESVGITGATLYVTGENVKLTGQKGLSVTGQGSTVKLCAGTYSSIHTDTMMIGDLLGHKDTTRYAYYDESGLIIGKLEEKSLSGVITVKECTHEGADITPIGNGSHGTTCHACGAETDEMPCNYNLPTEDDHIKACVCGATLKVTLRDAAELVYDGTEHKPGVTVTVDDEATLQESAYTVNYSNHKNAGDAIVTVTLNESAGIGTGTVSVGFTIGKAVPTIAWNEKAAESLFYTGLPAVITNLPAVTLVNDEIFSGTINYSYAVSGADADSYTDGLPVNAGTYTVRASIAEQDNYTAAESTNTLTLTIKPEGLWVSGLTESVPYTGTAIKQENIKVYHGSTLLREKTEYTISYKNNTNASIISSTDTDAKVNTDTRAQVIVTGKGNYRGKCTAEFTIDPIVLGNGTAEAGEGIRATIATATETGKTLKPAVTVTWNGKKLKEKKDYTLSYAANIKTASGEGYDVVITGKGNYTGSIVKKFHVKAKGTLLLNKATVKGLKKSYEYQSGEQVILPKGLQADLNNITVKVGGKTLTKDTDYTVRTENSSAVGTGCVVIETVPESAYAGEKRIAFNITGSSLKKYFITGLEKSYPYTGDPIRPGIEVYSAKNGAGMKVPSDAYTVSYSNHVNQGKATVTVTGIPDKGYSGSVKATYTIGKLNLGTNRAAEGNVDGIKVTMPRDIKYAKGGAKPQPVVTHTHEGKVHTLREGVDYTLKYSNNTAKYNSLPGDNTQTGGVSTSNASSGGVSSRSTKKPTVKITGIGNYTGTITENYDIAAQDMGSMEITVTDKAYNSKKKGSYYYAAPKVYDLDGKQLKSGKDYDVKYTYADGDHKDQEIGRTDPVENGTQIRVTVTAKEGGSYYGTLSSTYFVRDAKAVKDIAKVKNDQVPARQYTGSAIRPEVRLYTPTGKTKNYLTEEDYEIIGYYNNIKRGTATILIRGTGAYSGVKSITFKITSVDNKWIWSGIF